MCASRSTLSLPLTPGFVLVCGMIRRVLMTGSCLNGYRRSIMHELNVHIKISCWIFAIPFCTKYTVHAKNSQVHWGQLIATSQHKCICFLASQRGVFIEAALYSRQESLKEFCHIRELRERCIVLLKRDLERARERGKKGLHEFEVTHRCASRF